MSDVDTALSDHPHGVILSVWVIPGARKSEIAGLHNGGLRIRIAAPPTGGQANAVLLRYLRRELGFRVDLLTGARSRRKRVLVRGATRPQVSTALADRIA